jgi:hypothetical protein
MDLDAGGTEVPGPFRPLQVMSSQDCVAFVPLYGTIIRALKLENRLRKPFPPSLRCELSSEKKLRNSVGLTAFNDVGNGWGLFKSEPKDRMEGIWSETRVGIGSGRRSSEWRLLAVLSWSEQVFGIA